jgi:8-oxo-dGTP diphosphatase
VPYLYCPQCGSRLANRTIERRDRASCERCGFVDYENPKPCVGVLVVDAGKVLLVERAAEPFKGYWDIPGGFLDAAEGPAEAARREMLEETGLEIDPVEVLDFWLDAYGEDETTLNICYIARVVGGKPAPGSDAVNLRWFPLDDLPDNIAFTWEREALERLRLWLRG